MGDPAAREGLEPSIEDRSNNIEDGCKVISPGEEIKSAIPSSVDFFHPDQSEVKLADEVTENGNNEAKDFAKELTTEVKIGTRVTNSVSSNAEKASAKVRDAENWNERNRQRKDYKQNVKSDFTSQEMSDDPVAIRRQVEFYFSDSNLLVDRFLFTKVEGHQNLPVPLSIVHSFNRMRRFQPFSAVVEALKESTVLNLVENDTCVQRKIALAKGLENKSMQEVEQVYEDEAMARSIYAKGFGEEKPSTQFDIEAFFSDYGLTNSVRLRRTQQKVFKGSVFVEFDSEVTQKNFLALDPKPKWKGHNLEIKSKKQYCDDKVNDIRAGRVQANSEWVSRGDGQGSRGVRRGGDGNNRNWRARRDDDRGFSFGDNTGGRHRGFGSSGQNGRGGSRGGRGGRGQGRSGRDGRENNQRRSRDEHQVPKITTPTAEPSETLISTDSTEPLCAPQPSSETNPPESNKALAFKKHESSLRKTGVSTGSAETVSKKRAREETAEGPEIAKKPDLKSGEGLES